MALFHNGVKKIRRVNKELHKSHRTRAVDLLLTRPISERRGGRVSAMFPPMYTYTALPGYQGILYAKMKTEKSICIKWVEPLCEVKIEVTGHYETDARAAEEKSGPYNRVAYPHYVWHHVADIDYRYRGTIQLVPHAVHAAINHWGGSAMMKRRRKALFVRGLDGKLLITGS